MPAYIALLAGVILIFWLLRADFRSRSLNSTALWIPASWILVLGSRPIGYWLQFLGAGGDIASDTESSLPNTLFVALIIVTSTAVLIRRQCNFALVFQLNKALLILYLFLAASSLWSPDPFITFRRVIKDFGCVLVALVLLTEPRPWYACRVVFVRASYFLFTMSLVLAKYFPLIGRYRARAGDTQYCGLSIHKNSLGQMVLICILFLVWDLTEIGNELPSSDLKSAKRFRYLVISIGLLLLFMAQSATAEICLILGGFLFYAYRQLTTMPNGRRIFRIGLFTIIVLGLANTTLGISGAVAELFGRNSTLTGRTAIWDVALSHQIHPINGFGYYAFWDTEVAATIYDELGDFIHIRTIHNGYLEVFIDGGIIGVILLALYIISTGRSAHSKVFDLVPPTVFPLLLWTVALVYNNSESSFFRLDLLWFTFVVVTTNLPFNQAFINRGNDRILASEMKVP